MEGKDSAYIPVYAFGYEDILSKFHKALSNIMWDQKLNWKLIFQAEVWTLSPEVHACIYEDLFASDHNLDELCNESACFMELYASDPFSCFPNNDLFRDLLV